MTLAPCPTHGSTYRALHEHNFRGIVEVIDDLFLTISGVVGTTSYSRCAVGYPWNFEGIVRALEDLNTTISGIQGGGANIAAGSGIYTTTSGDVTLINSAIVGGSGVYITYSGSYAQVNTSVTAASGIIYTAGSGLYLSDGGTRLNLGAYGEGSTSVTYNGNQVAISGTAGASAVTVSGSPAAGYEAGQLWFDTNQGRLFVYASGNGVASPVTISDELYIGRRTSAVPTVKLLTYTTNDEGSTTYWVLPAKYIFGNNPAPNKGALAIFTVAADGILTPTQLATAFQVAFNAAVPATIAVAAPGANPGESTVTSAAAGYPVVILVKSSNPGPTVTQSDTTVNVANAYSTDLQEMVNAAELAGEANPLAESVRRFYWITDLQANDVVNAEGFAFVDAQAMLSPIRTPTMSGSRIGQNIRLVTARFSPVVDSM